MSRTLNLALIPGDGIGTEIVNEAVKVLNALGQKFEMETAPVGGAGYEAHGHPLPPGTLKLAKEADAILFGAVGGDPLGDRQADTAAGTGDEHGFPGKRHGISLVGGG